MHSRGSRVDIALSYGHGLTLRVADDGVGMEPAVAERGKEGHFGLRGMRERAGRIGATLSVTSAPGTGTAIIVTVPGASFSARHARLSPRGSGRCSSERTRHPRSSDARTAVKHHGQDVDDLWCADCKRECMLADRRYCYPLMITAFVT